MNVYLSACLFVIGFSGGFCSMCCWSIFVHNREHREVIDLFDKLFAIVQHKLGPVPTHLRSVEAEHHLLPTQETYDVDG